MKKIFEIIPTIQGNYYQVKVNGKLFGIYMYYEDIMDAIYLNVNKGDEYKIVNENNNWTKLSRKDLGVNYAV